MLSGNTVKSTHVTLGLVPEVLDPVDMIPLVDKLFRVIDPVMFELGYIQDII